MRANKMEKCVLINSINQLKNTELDKYGRVYFGNEFCSRLFPSISDFIEAVNIFLKKEINYTLVMPYGDDIFIEKFSKLIKTLKEKNIKCEIVINDIGCLEYLIRDKNNFVLILGRLLSMQCRNPWIKSDNINSYTLKEHNYSSEIFVNCFKKFNIQRFELDNTFQKISIIKNSKIKYSLYYPYVLLTTTNRCIIPSIIKYEDKPIIQPIECEKECLYSHILCKNRNIKKRSIMRGNTQFLINKNINNKIREGGIDRLIYQPNIPL